MERIEDDTIRRMYEEIINYYSNMIQCIETIGKGKSFYYNSLSVYGTPTEKDVQNAQFILHYEDEPLSLDMQKVHNPFRGEGLFFGVCENSTISH